MFETKYGRQDDATFAFERNRLFERLISNQTKRSVIEEVTTCEQYRATLLTASNFERLISCYDGIVKSILYTDISRMNQIAHGTSPMVYKKTQLRNWKKPALSVAEFKCPHSTFEKVIDRSILGGTFNI